MPRTLYKKQLCELYVNLNRRDLVSPDPLQFLYDYDDLPDREIVALIASGLAYGGVRQILKSVANALERVPSPHLFVSRASRRSLIDAFAGFKHRFTTGEELATMLFGVKRTLESHGSLQACFNSHFQPEHESILPALTGFVNELSCVFNGRPRSLLPSPEKGSACKRLNLFLRWMVRCDVVDPGGWDDIPCSKLIVPVDTHMHRLSLQLGLTSRKQANLRTALEITDAFRKIDPDDPVRFDFCLTRLGIRDDTDPEVFLKMCREACVQREEPME
ncbi:TIGR02757 family protein [Thermodesulfobacteriota bacterium]